MTAAPTTVLLEHTPDHTRAASHQIRWTKPVNHVSIEIVWLDLRCRLCAISIGMRPVDIAGRVPGPVLDKRVGDPGLGHPVHDEVHRNGIIVFLVILPSHSSGSTQDTLTVPITRTTTPTMRRFLFSFFNCT
jgi:hypothetical protein